MGFFGGKAEMVPESAALPGRATPLSVPEHHEVNGERIQPPFASGLEQAVFGLGCFWGAERLFWRLPGVVATAAHCVNAIPMVVAAEPGIIDQCRIVPYGPGG